MAPTCNLQLPSLSTITEAVKQVPRALTNLFDCSKAGLKECSGFMSRGKEIHGGKEMNNIPEQEH